MSFKELRGLTETKKQKEDAASGFENRLKEYEKRFLEESKQIDPSNDFYERSYDI